MKSAAIALAVALVLLPTAKAEELPKDATENIVAIQVNSTPKLSSSSVMQTPDGDLWLTVDTWKSLEISIPDGATGSLGAKSLGIEVKLNSLTQTMELTVPFALLPSQRLGRDRTTRIDKTDAQPKGVLLNYDLAGRVDQQGKWGLSAGHEVRTGVAGGVLRTTGQLNFNAEKTGYVRGLTTWQKDFLRKGSTLQVGDTFTAPTTLSPAVNLGGFRIASDRALNGGASTWPVPLLGGIAETQSTADLYVNQSRSGQHTLEPGPYQLDSYPVVNGRNEVQLIIKDDYGREKTISKSFYHSSNNLKRGTTEYDVSAGLVRQGRTDTYGIPAVSAKVEHGITDQWTAGASLQSTGDKSNLAVSNRITLGAAGALNLEVASSSTPEGKGAAWAAAYEYQTRNWAFRASHSEYSDDHWTLANDVQPGIDGLDFRLKSTTALSGSYSPRGKNFTLGASYVAIDYQSGREVQRIGVDGRYRRNASSLAFGASFDLVEKEPRLSLTYRYDFGNSRSMAVGVQAAPDIRAAAVMNGRTPIKGQEWQWSAGASHSQSQGVAAFGRASTRLDNGDLRLNLQYREDASEASASYSGSLWMGEGGVLAQRPVPGSFALVEVEDQPNVEVKVGGYSGKTNKHGYTLVPNVSALQETSVSIKPDNVPLDRSFDNTEKKMVAGRQAGVKVKFSLASTQMREIRVERNGVPIEGSAEAKTDKETAIVGMGGTAFLTSPEPGQVVKVQTVEGFCQATLPDSLPSFEEVMVLDCQKVH